MCLVGIGLVVFSLIVIVSPFCFVTMLGTYLQYARFGPSKTTWQIWQGCSQGQADLTCVI